MLIWTFNSHYNTSLELFPNYLWSLYKKQNQGEKEMHENVILRIDMCMLTRSCPRRCLNHISMVEIHKKKGVYWGIIPLHYRELYWFWPITSITNLSFLPMSYNSNSTSCSHNNGMESEVIGLGSIRCVYYLPIKKIKINKIKLEFPNSY